MKGIMINKWTIPDSPLSQQGARELINWLTLIFSFSILTPFPPPPKKKHSSPLNQFVFDWDGLNQYVDSSYRGRG